MYFCCMAIKIKFTRDINFVCPVKYVYSSFVCGDLSMKHI